MQLHSIIGIAASILTAGALLPQLIKIIKDKKAENISVVMMLVIFLGNILWIYYGYLGDDVIIISSNSVSCIINICLYLLTVKYKKRSDVGQP